MASAIASDGLAHAALWIGAGALAVSLAVVASTFVLRLRLLAHLGRERRFRARWQPLFASCVDAVPISPPALARADGLPFLRLWVRAMESTRGQTREHLAQLAHRVGADRMAVGLLASGSPREELIGLLALGHLRAPGLARHVRDLVAAQAVPISLAAAEALLRIDARELDRLLPVAVARADWPIGRIAAMLAECGPEHAGAALTHAIHARLDEPALQAPALIRLLKLHVTAHPETLRPALLRVFEHDLPPGVMAASLEALQHPADAPHARAAASHPEWFVRVAAAKALGRIGTARDTAVLLRLLSDRHWWVRYRSAQALARLPGVKPEHIEELRRAARDPYAADMLAQVRSEMELA